MYLFQLAHELGIRVRWRRHMDDVGRWYPRTKKIALRHDLTQNEARCVLGHELGHAILGHECQDDEAHELEADKWAASVLIDIDELIDTINAYPDSPAYWCEELGITPDILRAWLQTPGNYAEADRRLKLSA